MSKLPIIFMRVLQRNTQIFESAATQMHFRGDILRFGNIDAGNPALKTSRTIKEDTNEAILFRFVPFSLLQIFLEIFLEIGCAIGYALHGIFRKVSSLFYVVIFKAGLFGFG